MRLQGKNCSDGSSHNRYGNGDYPFDGGLGGIDILNGGCTTKNDGGGACWYTNWDSKSSKLNTRCQQSQADSVFMFLTVVVLFVVLALTYLRIKRTH